MDPVLLFFAGVTAFILFRLISVMGTRTGHEQRNDLEALQRAARSRATDEPRDEDEQAADEAPAPKPVSTNARVLRDADPAFDEKAFLEGARGAYEWILMAFENGNLDQVAPFLAEDVYEAFAQVVDSRQEQGLTVEAEFVGVRGTTLADARFDNTSNRAEVTVKFIGELISVVKDQNGEIIEGKPGQSKRQKDTWTFERVMGSGDPNWRLVATGE